MTNDVMEKMLLGGHGGQPKVKGSTSPTRRWSRRSQQRRPNRKAALNGSISE